MGTDDGSKPGINPGPGLFGSRVHVLLQTSFEYLLN